MKILRLLTLAGAFALAGTAPAQADVFAFVDMPMTGTQQSPAVASSGFGSFSGLYDNTTKVLVFNVTWQLQPNATVTGAHFHGPAGLGQNADIAIPVNGLAAANSGRFGGSATLTTAQESDLLAGRWYFNIHSSAAASGELRGQLIENAATAASARFSTATGTLTLPAVLVPELGVYGAQLQLTPGSDPLQFTLTGATALR